MYVRGFRKKNGAPPTLPLIITKKHNLGSVWLRVYLATVQTDQRYVYGEIPTRSSRSHRFVCVSLLVLKKVGSENHRTGGWGGAILRVMRYRKARNKAQRGRPMGIVARVV